MHSFAYSKKRRRRRAIDDASRLVCHISARRPPSDVLFISLGSLLPYVWFSFSIVSRAYPSSVASEPCIHVTYQTTPILRMYIHTSIPSRMHAYLHPDKQAKHHHRHTKNKAIIAQRRTTQSKDPPIPSPSHSIQPSRIRSV